MVFFNGLNYNLNQWFEPFGLNQPTLIYSKFQTPQHIDNSR